MNGQENSGTPTFARSLFSIYTWVGLLLASLSLVKLIQTAFALGLSPTVAFVVDWYRLTFHPIVDYLFALLPFQIHPTGTQKDVIVAFLAVLALLSRLLVRSGYLAGVGAAAFPYILLALRRLGQFSWWLVQVLFGAGISYIVYSYPPIKAALDGIWS